jgi:hypothetical protein
MSNLSPRAKLTLRFFFVIVLLLCIGDTGYYSQAQMWFPAAKPKIEPEILLALADIEINIHKMQVAALNGLYRKDVRPPGFSKDEQNKPRPDGKKSYRDYLCDHANAVATDTAQLLKKVSESYKKAGKDDSVKLCDDTAKLLQAYAEQADVWADLQDDIHNSADKRVALANETQMRVKNIVNRIIHLAEQGKQKMDAHQADGTVIKGVEFTELRRLMQLKDLGEILEGIEITRRLTRELATITDPDALKGKSEQVVMKFDEVTKQLAVMTAAFQTAANKEDALAAEKAFAEWKNEMNFIIKKMNEQEALTRKMGEIADNATKNVIKLLPWRLKCPHRLSFA